MGLVDDEEFYLYFSNAHIRRMETCIYSLFYFKLEMVREEYMITITEKAGEHLASLATNSNKVEFSVSGGGCSGMNYELQFIDRELNDRDQIIYFANGTMQLVVPFASYVYLTGTEIDYSTDLLNGGFKFGNPQANRTCGCGTSFSV